MDPSHTALSIQPLSRMLRGARRLFAGLLAATVVLLVWHHYGMEKIVDLTDGRYRVGIEDDRQANGASVGRLERRGRDILMHCALKTAYQYPYCKLTVTLQATGDGLDLSDFSHFTVDAVYGGKGTAKINLLVVNAEEGFTRPDRWESYKINELNNLAVTPDGPVVAPIKWFAVAPWWKDIAHPPLEHSYVRMDNVNRIEITNSAGTADGDFTVTIRSVKVHGKLVSTGTLLTVLIGLWIFAAVSFPTVTAVLLRRQLQASGTALALLTQVNKALELETRELAGQAHIDPLTGVLNRQGLRAELIGTSALLTAPVSVIFIDIDHFKRINDTHGHDVGDEVLRKFAHVIGSSLRPSDRLVRWGGEEFLIICPVTDVYQANLVAESLRTGLHGQAWPAGLAVTASFGVAQHADGEDFGVVIKRADSELYGAKANGRDRVHAYGMDKPPAGPGAVKPVLAQVA